MRQAYKTPASSLGCQFCETLRSCRTHCWPSSHLLPGLPKFRVPSGLSLSVAFISMFSSLCPIWHSHGSLRGVFALLILLGKITIQIAVIYNSLRNFYCKEVNEKVHKKAIKHGNTKLYWIFLVLPSKIIFCAYLIICTRIYYTVTY